MLVWVPRYAAGCGARRQPLVAAANPRSSTGTTVHRGAVQPDTLPAWSRARTETQYSWPGRPGSVIEVAAVYCHGAGYWYPANPAFQDAAL